METMKMQAGGDNKILKELEKTIKIHKYIGETNRSAFERGWEHQNDYENLSTKSHMLKHAVETHPHEDPKQIQFGMKVVRFTKSSFERQILESVEIQSNRQHHLLNSRSEFNRCAVPRMMCKLGDKSFKKNEQEIEKDLAREEAQVTRIRELVKERNKNRGETSRIHGKAPGAKRRKIDNEKFETGQEKHGGIERQEPEKRKEMEENENMGPENKKRKVSQDIRSIIQKMTTRNLNQQEHQEQPNIVPDQQEQPRVEQEENEKDEEPERHAQYGQEEHHELVDWEEIFHKHLEETRQIEQRRQEQMEKAEKKEKSWQLLRECTSFLRENEKNWKFDSEKPKLKKKLEERNRKLSLAKTQKEYTLKKIRQKKDI